MSEIELLTAAEVAERFGVAIKTVHRWANAGALPVAYQTAGIRGARLFRPEDVEALATRMEKSA